MIKKNRGRRKEERGKEEKRQKLVLYDRKKEGEKIKGKVREKQEEYKTWRNWKEER